MTMHPASTIPAGLAISESAHRPRVRQPMLVVIPQPGHGIPSSDLQRQTCGHSVTPLRIEPATGINESMARCDATTFACQAVPGSRTTRRVNLLGMNAITIGSAPEIGHVGFYFVPGAIARNNRIGDIDELD
jgi:hypothetical protein